MIRIMLHCSWTYNCDKCDFDSVRARLIKHTSKLRNELKSQILNSLTDEEKVVHKEMLKSIKKGSGEGESDLEYSVAGTNTIIGSSSDSEDSSGSEDVDEEEKDEEKDEEKEEYNICPPCFT
ncbi:bromodomain adjacent to zinc finger domain protein 2B-like [Frankliniella occidentalis]|uniref:Bromodomain adjacent to zinc finger domain protein 2B-like n=1 Tax=Frankliniella occidentalis TaxID=133901 RepID=A0A9C6XWV6_FRAOC|nr:bromodomain adjacent to zinc finger domain protein 2B-like [Frankliniella occidentalis]